MTNFGFVPSAEHPAIAASRGRRRLATERKRRRRAERASRNLSRKLLEVAETERRHLARELHDEVGQSLTALQINLQLLRQSLSAPQRTALLGQSAGIVERLLARVRGLSLDLRPAMLDDLGLVPAVQWYLDRQAARTGVAMELKPTACETRFAPEVETACFRIVQEAVNNAVKHACARHVTVQLVAAEAFLDVAITDDGAGFDLAHARAASLHGDSVGLLGMEERAALLGGRLEIDATPGAGCSVRARLPLVPPRPGADRPILPTS